MAVTSELECVDWIDPGRVAGSYRETGTGDCRERIEGVGGVTDRARKDTEGSVREAGAVVQETNMGNA